MAGPQDFPIVFGSAFFRDPKTMINSSRLCGVVAVNRQTGNALAAGTANPNQEIAIPLGAQFVSKPVNVTITQVPSDIQAAARTAAEPSTTPSPEASAEPDTAPSVSPADTAQVVG